MKPRNRRRGLALTAACLFTTHCGTPPPSVPTSTAGTAPAGTAPQAPLAPGLGEAWAPLPRPSGDAYGDPLPDGVLARLGTARFRSLPADPVQTEDDLRDLAVSGDGKLLAALTGQGIAVYDAGSGRSVGACLADLPSSGLVGLAFAAHAPVLVVHDEVQSYTCRFGGAEAEERVFPPSLAAATEPLPATPAARKKPPRRPPACAALSPDGATLARCEKGGEVSLWDVASAQRLRVLKGHAKHASAVAYEPNGARLATGGADEAVVVWEAASGKKVRSVPLAKARGVRSLAWARDGATLAATTVDDSVRLLDPDKGAVVTTLRAPAPPPGSRLPVPNVPPEELGEAVGDGGALLAEPWDCATAPLARAELSADGALVATWLGAQEVGCGGAEPSEVWLWDAKTGAVVRRLAPTSFGAAFLPQGELVTSDHDGLLRFWSAATGAERVPFERHLHDIAGIAFAPDGAAVATLDGDDELRLWSAASGAHQRRVRLEREHPTSLALGPAGALAVGYGDGAVELRDTATGEVRQRTQTADGEAPTRVGFAPGTGRLFAVTPTALTWWDGAPLAEQKRVAAEGETSFGLSAVAGTTLAVTTGPREVALHDLGDGTRRGLVRLPAAGEAGAPVASGAGEPGDPGDAAPDEAADEGDAEEDIAELALSADASRLALVTATRVVVWDLAAGKALGDFEHGSAEWLPAVSFARQGNWLVLGTAGGLELCDARTGDVLSASGESGAVTALVPFGPQIVASGNHTGTVLLWDLAALPIDTPLTGGSAR
ncbi:MAG: WD40 repeat domain-containing protein [Polyangiaceae bacterium]|nr:WD40 repeat domain-containing protein [Polyangiaceae bacterium]